MAKKFSRDNLKFLKSDYPGWVTLYETVDRKTLAARDAKDVVGLSYRQLNDWEVRGNLRSAFAREMKEKTEGWRRFSVLDLICLGILMEAKRHGISITSLRHFIDHIFMSKDHLYQAFGSLVEGRDVYVYSNLDTWTGIAGLGPDDKHIALPVQDLRESKIIVIIPLSRIVDDIFGRLQLEGFEAIKKPEGGYRFIINGVPLALEEPFNRGGRYE